MQEDYDTPYFDDEWLMSSHATPVLHVQGACRPPEVRARLFMRTRLHMVMKLRAKMGDAIDESKWIGESEIVTVEDIPYPLTSGVLFSSVVRFGRLYSFGVLSLFGLFAAALFALWRWSENASVRVYILIYGALLVAPAFHSVAEAFGFAPLVCVSIPLVSFGGMPLLVAGLGFGILWSAVAYLKVG